MAGTLRRPVFSPATLIGLFLGGGLALSACNQIHVEAGILSYPAPDALDQAWWAPLVFGAAAVVICAGALPFARRVAAPRPSQLVGGAAWFAAAYAATGIVDSSPGWLAAGLAVAWAARVGFRAERVPLATYSLLLAAAGTGVEAAMTGAGMFEYAREDVLGVPIWLPCLYLNGGPLALAVAGRLYWTASPRGSTTSHRPPNSTTSWQRTSPGGSST